MLADMNLTQSYTRLPDHFYKKILPTPVNEPQLVIWNDHLASELGMKDEPENYTSLLSGNEMPATVTPIAQAYAGHQFGNFTMLGDGRAILLGETETVNRESKDVQLKGSGRTPYSRGGDGRAALGPMLREYMISEAMHHLGIPTTRSLAVVYSGEGIQRKTVKPGAILTRIATSHIRVGTFQYASQFGTVEDLKALTDYTISHHHITTGEEPYLDLLQNVISKQAKLIAQWQLFGFIHGVMNTDNMAISGETIDYGPCAFLDNYNPATVFSSIDQNSRYAYGNQPGIAGWNLARFAETLIPLLDTDQEAAIQKAQSALDEFPVLFQQAYNAGLVKKIGIPTTNDEAVKLASDFLNLMHQEKADFTLTFRQLAQLDFVTGTFFTSKTVQDWLIEWKRMTNEYSQEQLIAVMQQVNPVIIPRNHLVQDALDHAEATGSMEKYLTLLHQLEKPYDYSSEQLAIQQLPPDNTQPFVTYCGT